MRATGSSEVLVSLPMYDWPEIRAATDTFWSGLAHHLGVSGTLLREGRHEHPWRQSDLYFSQTCGYPLTHEFKGLLKYVATPHYRAEGCAGPNYSSFIFCREGASWRTFQQARPAINAPDSMSGGLALKLWFAGQSPKPDVLQPPLITGSHAASLAAVQESKADICAIDSVCVALAKRHRPDLLSGLTAIAQSPLVPGLPFVTRCADVAKLRQGLQAAFADPNLRSARHAMLLEGVTVLPDGAYDQILALEAHLEF